MAFTINTNIASLQSQEYLRISNEFQQKTINRVTSGLRIVSSGDDAAGLSIANGFRSDRAVLGQGVRNANDGLSTLQTIDGGINNITQLLDRARTLAAQSASGTFNGDRTVLDSEFQSVIAEIDRQAQAIGLNIGGVFAKNLSVFIGGGRGGTAAAQISNGSVAVDLSASTVDGRSLGLKGLQVTGVAASAVDDILAGTTNTQSETVPGFTDFYFRGPGFSDEDRVRVSVNLNGVDDPNKLLTAINSSIDQAGSGRTAVATAFKNAGIRAVVITDPNNDQKLVFQSSTSAFQISAGDRLSNALLGNSTNNVGTALDQSVSGEATAASTGTTVVAQSDIIVRVEAGSLGAPVDLTLSVTTSTTVDTALSNLSSLVANNSRLIAAGISVTESTPGANLTFSSKRGEDFEVLAANDLGGLLGLGTAQTTIGTSATSFDVTSITSSAVLVGAGPQTLVISVGGGAYVTLSHTFTGATTADEVVNTLNNNFASNATLQQGGLVAATTAGGAIIISSNNGTYFRVSTTSSDGGFGFGLTSASGVTTTTTVATTSNTTAATLNSGGASTTPLLSFTPIRNGNDDQVITLTAKDSTGTEQSIAITLGADGTTQNARSIDEAVHYINSQIQASASEDLKKLVAVKERDPAAGGAEKIRFLSELPNFKVSVGSNPGTSGISSDQGTVVDSTQLPGGANIDISSQSNAEAAVNALAKAVSKLGAVQAVVGRGQNQFNFAISLAQTQIINLNASESRIRDADLAAEAANLAKAQVLQQAGIAALAQANSAPQAVLSLLRG
jgi:flagellin